MGLDSITGASIILLGGAIGFSTGPLNINTTIVAQKIAGLPLYSGVGYRFICFAVFYVITNIYLIRYALKIQKNPELSPMYGARQDQRVPATLRTSTPSASWTPADPHHAGLLRIPYPHVYGGSSSTG